jgi:hypothetical protein
MTIKERLEKRVRLIERLENLRNEDNSELLDELTDLIISQECQWMQVEEAIGRVNEVINLIRNRPGVKEALDKPQMM